MKNTPFTEKHIALGAKMAPFAGYNMPIQYTGINEEHAVVREGVGVFDVSHMGEIWVTGPNALAFLQYVSSNDVSVLFPGKAQYTCFPNGKGGIVDDFIVYCFNTEKYLLAVNAANIEKDWNHLCSFAPKFGLVVGKDLCNLSDETAQLAIQGPKALEVMQKLCKENVTDMEYYTFKQIEVAGIPDAIFSTTGYTGSSGPLSSQQVSPTASSPSASAHATPCVSNWDSASTATTSTTPPPRLRPASAGSPSSTMSRAISSTRSISSPRRKPA